MTTSQGAAYSFIYDATAGIPAVLAEKAASGNARLYIRTPDGRLIARVTATETPALDFYYHFDGLGSTRALTDADGDITDTYDYDVWGNLLTHTGTTDQPYQFVGQLGYHTHYQDAMLDPESGYTNGGYPMLQLGVRYYVPEIGRFTQRDPIRSLTSAYTYADCSPVTKMDPAGEFPTINCPGAGQEQRIRSALRRICDNMAAYYSHTTGPRQQAALRAFCNNGQVQCGSRHCVTSPRACGHTLDTTGRPDTSGRGRVYICLVGFTRACDTGSGNPEGETLLHEIFHRAGSGDPGAECRMQRCRAAVFGR